MFLIRDLLIRYGFGSALFSSSTGSFQESPKTSFLQTFLLLSLGTLTSVFKDKKSLRSTGTINRSSWFFLIFFIVGKFRIRTVQQFTDPDLDPELFFYKWNTILSCPGTGLWPLSPRLPASCHVPMTSWGWASSRRPTWMWSDPTQVSASATPPPPTCPVTPDLSGHPLPFRSPPPCPVTP